jgi:hypothetical protein
MHHPDPVISDTKGFNMIRTEDIIKCAADGYCTTFYQTGKKKVTSSKNLKYDEDLLHSGHLFSVHRNSKNRI